MKGFRVTINFNFDLQTTDNIASSEATCNALFEACEFRDDYLHTSRETGENETTFYCNNENEALAYVSFKKTWIKREIEAQVKMLRYAASQIQTLEKDLLSGRFMQP